MNSDAPGAKQAATHATPAEHWEARLALLLAAASLAVLLIFAGIRGSVALIVIGLVGFAVCLAGVWWFLTRRGVLRWLAAALAIAAPIVIVVMYARRHLIWELLVSLVLLAGAVAAGRAALTRPGVADGPAEQETPPPKRPFLIMNPRSGGGKVGKFGLADKARALGAEVSLMEGPGEVDVAALARQAVAAGADLLGVAGGDGTQALVAGIAAEHGLPFMVISAGTRNHFALDLGLDREDPSTCLDALSDGVEIRIDLGLIGDRTFVNNASFGAYAAVVQSPAYRDDKTHTTLQMLPELLTGHRGPQLSMRAREDVVSGPQAVLVSNNAYEDTDIAGLGRRDRLDGGVLGVLAVKVSGAAEAASLVRGVRSRALTMTTVPDVVIDADDASIPVGIDGEAVTLPTPVRCSIRPRALRVRVPRHRPGVRAPRPEMDWGRLWRLAFSTGAGG